ncbi:MAG: COX15/CtaA family protein [Pseudomonadales bacterium]|jgi:cytochrome c oxidase assembly protein subunit 15
MNDKIALARKVVIAALVITALAVNLGAFTRLVDAGLGCPDWPGCYGHALWPNEAHEVIAANQAFPDTPVEADKTWPEMVHRYFASTVGLFIIGLVLLCWRNGPRKLSIGLLFMVLLQGAFGAWTVTLKLWPQVVTLHLLGGFTTLALLWLLFQRLWRFKWPQNSGLVALKRLAVVATFAVVLQVALGGWTSSNYAALACTDLPTCHGYWLPTADYQEGFDIFQEIGPNYLGGQLDNDARIAIHFSHRVGAIVVTLILLTLLLKVWRVGDHLARRWVLATGLVLGAQIALGLSNIIFALPLTVAVLHNAGGAALLLCLVTLNHRLFTMTTNAQHAAVEQRA